MFLHSHWPRTRRDWCFNDVSAIMEARTGLPNGNISLPWWLVTSADVTSNTFPPCQNFKHKLLYSGFLQCSCSCFILCFCNLLFSMPQFLILYLGSQSHAFQSFRLNLSALPCFPSDVCVAMSRPRLFLYCPRLRNFRWLTVSGF